MSVIKIINIYEYLGVKLLCILINLEINIRSFFKTFGFLSFLLKTLKMKSVKISFLYLILYSHCIGHNIDATNNKLIEQLLASPIYGGGQTFPEITNYYDNTNTDSNNPGNSIFKETRLPLVC